MKSNQVITVENVSKLYRLGEVGTGTIANDLKRWWYSVRGKEDPFMEVGRSNDRAEDGGTLDYVWSLRDINFNVAQGEVLGIIGKNGAGKSTLLKILSKITAPTTGKITLEGRVASLLEVGTGFHKELTGRENIFLNGTILGMSKPEVQKKLDEIVDFSGVAKYLDTPVKRYSSGMLVRLGFAVAAHLEPEILIVDEVLAVGDAEFQKKCVGKMKDVSGEGRTVLFVSHNMAAVRSLCTQAIYLQKGNLIEQGNANDIVDSYLSLGGAVQNHKILKAGESLGSENIELLEIGITRKDKPYTDPIAIEHEVEVNFKFDVRTSNEYDVSIQFKDDSGMIVFSSNSLKVNKLISKAGINEISATIPANFFNIGLFYIDLVVVSRKSQLEFRATDILSFETKEEPLPMGHWMGRQPGALKPEFEWTRK